ncbi:hypothetical protein J2T02_004786 [Chitinophaga terrae (ex Kim and Jung 2007)]|nr:hypothetical protein [Chitinophaga terrae (ex Kim and Jung 2007)]
MLIFTTLYWLGEPFRIKEQVVCCSFKKAITAGIRLIYNLALKCLVGRFPFGKTFFYIRFPGLLTLESFEYVVLIFNSMLPVVKNSCR